MNTLDQRSKSRRLLLATLLGLVVLAGCDGAGEQRAGGDQTSGQPAPKAPRAAMNLGYIHDLEDVAAGGPVTVKTDAGNEIEIDEAYLVITAVEAHLCEPAPTKEGLLEPLENLLVAPAYAHVPSSATRLGIPFVEDLLAESRARIVGEIAPPLGEYCKLYAVVSPADQDVMNLGQLDTADIVGKSLLLRGRWRKDAESTWQPFSSASTARDVVEMAAVDPNSGEQPLKLAEPGASRMMLIDKTVSPATFAGLTVDDLDGPAAAEAVLDRLEDSLRIRQFKKK